MRLFLHASLDFVELIRQAEVTLEGLGCAVVVPDLNRYQHIRDELGQQERFDEMYMFSG